MIDILDLFRIAPPFRFGGLEGSLEFVGLVFMPALAITSVAVDPYTSFTSFVISDVLMEEGITVTEVLELGSIVFETLIDSSMVFGG